MKFKLLFCIFCMTIFASFGFKDVESNIILPSHFKKEYIKTSDSKDLQQVLTNNFTDLFDHIHQVDVHLNPDGGYYYYAVYGTKDKEATVQLFKVSEEYALNQTFPVLEKTAENASSRYCYYRYSGACLPNKPYVMSLRCGINSGGYCIPF